MTMESDRGGGIIGVFDSGLGGLTVVRELRRLLPHENIIYLGDTARLPYGNKSPRAVIRYAKQALQFLELAAVELAERHLQSLSSTKKLEKYRKNRYQPFLKLVVIACNTATAHALEPLRQLSSVPVVGVIRPAVKEAIARTSTRSIGIIGTEGTIRSGAYQEALRRELPSAEIRAKACSLLVPLVEEGWLSHPVTELTLKTYLSEWFHTDLDTLILGCTHYPLLKEAIEGVFPRPINLIDPSESVAKDVSSALQKRGWLNTSGERGELICFVTDLAQKFKPIAERFLGEELRYTEQIDLERFVPLPR